MYHTKYIKLIFYNIKENDGTDPPVQMDVRL